MGPYLGLKDACREGSTPGSVGARLTSPGCGGRPGVSRSALWAALGPPRRLGGWRRRSRRGLFPERGPQGVSRVKDAAQAAVPLPPPRAPSRGLQPPALTMEPTSTRDSTGTRRRPQGRPARNLRAPAQRARRREPAALGRLRPCAPGTGPALAAPPQHSPHSRVTPAPPHPSPASPQPRHLPRPLSPHPASPPPQLLCATLQPHLEMRGFPAAASQRGRDLTTQMTQ